MPRWTEQSRKEHAEKMRKWKPWERSTGPKTDAGKAISALNAYKHGMRSAEMLYLYKLLTIQKQMIKSLNDSVLDQELRLPPPPKNRQTNYTKIPMSLRGTFGTKQSTHD